MRARGELDGHESKLNRGGDKRQEGDQQRLVSGSDGAKPMAKAPNTIFKRSSTPPIRASARGDNCSAQLIWRALWTSRPSYRAGYDEIVRPRLVLGLDAASMTLSWLRPCLGPAASAVGVAPLRPLRPREPTDPKTKRRLLGIASEPRR
jgi:hypothetical protein